MEEAMGRRVRRAAAAVVIQRAYRRHQKRQVREAGMVTLTAWRAAAASSGTR